MPKSKRTGRAGNRPPIFIAMKEIETINAYIKTEHGKTVCICHERNKQCEEDCEIECVYRDRFADWQKVMKRDKYGR